MAQDMRLDGTRELQYYRAIDFDSRKELVTAKNLPYVRNFVRGYPERVSIQQQREHAETGLCHWETLDEESEAMNARNGVDNDTDETLDGLPPCSCGTVPHRSNCEAVR